MSQIRKFFAILRLELEDVQDDLESMIHVYQQKDVDSTLGGNILRSNAAIFKKEIASIKDFISQVDKDNGNEDSAIAEVMEKINRGLPARVQKFEYPLVVVDVVRRKMEKIKAYFEYSP